MIPSLNYVDAYANEWEYGTTDTWTLRVWAVCGDRVGTHRTVWAESAANSNNKGVTATCPDDTVVTGTGWDVVTGTGQVLAESVVPYTDHVTVNAYEVFAELGRKFEVYNLRVKYHDDARDAEIRAQWQKAIGNERVLRLEDPRRIVDCILGLTALVANDYEQFKDRLAKRQTDEQVQQVIQTLHPLLPGQGGPS